MIEILREKERDTETEREGERERGDRERGRDRERERDRVSEKMMSLNTNELKNVFQSLIYEFTLLCT